MTDYYVAFYAKVKDGIGGCTYEDIPTIESTAFNSAEKAIENFNDYHEKEQFAYMLEVSEDSVKKLDDMDLLN